MPPRLLLALCTLVACALAAVVGVALAARDPGPRATQEEEYATGWAGSQRPPGIPPQDFVLRDQDGEPASPADHRGGPVVVTFLYSTCEDTCPGQAQAIRGALDDLGRDVPVLAVSVDPANDTPRRARRFLVAQSMTGRMRFLLGDRAELARVWKGFGIAPQTADLEHSAYVVLLDARGRQRIGFPADKLTSEGLVHDLRRLGA